MVLIPSGCLKMNDKNNKIAKIYSLILSVFPIIMYVVSSYLFKLANVSTYHQQNNSWWIFPLPHMLNVLCILVLSSYIKKTEYVKLTAIISVIYIILLGSPIWALILTGLKVSNIFSPLLMIINFDNMSIILEMFVFYCFICITILKK